MQQHQSSLSSDICYIVNRWEHLVYQFGSYQHIISHVMKNGQIVHSKTT